MEGQEEGTVGDTTEEVVRREEVEDTMDRKEAENHKGDDKLNQELAVVAAGVDEDDKEGDRIQGDQVDGREVEEDWCKKVDGKIGDILEAHKRVDRWEVTKNKADIGLEGDMEDSLNKGLVGVHNLEEEEEEAAHK